MPFLVFVSSVKMVCHSPLDRGDQLGKNSKVPDVGIDVNNNQQYTEAVTEAGYSIVVKKIALGAK